MFRVQAGLNVAPPKDSAGSAWQVDSTLAPQLEPSVRPPGSSDASAAAQQPVADSSAYMSMHGDDVSGRCGSLGVADDVWAMPCGDVGLDSTRHERHNFSGGFPFLNSAVGGSWIRRDLMGEQRGPVASPNVVVARPLDPSRQRVYPALSRSYVEPLRVQGAAETDARGAACSRSLPSGQRPRGIMECFRLQLPLAFWALRHHRTQGRDFVAARCAGEGDQQRASDTLGLNSQTLQDEAAGGGALLMPAVDGDDLALWELDESLLQAV